MFGLIRLGITAIVSGSSFPVHLVSILGILTSFFSLLGCLSIIAIKIFSSKAIPGWASMMTAIAFSSGIQLFCLGMIGEYIARIYDEAKSRPLFIVESVREKNSRSQIKAA